MNVENRKPARGSERERPSRWRGNKPAVSKGEWTLLATLMVLPAWATLQQSATILPRYLIGYAVAISTITFLVYRHDKMRAVWWLAHPGIDIALSGGAGRLARSVSRSAGNSAQDLETQLPSDILDHRRDVSTRLLRRHTALAL